MSSSSSISLRICSASLALADHPLRRDAGDAVGAAGELIERGIGLLMGLRPHDVGDAEPLLVAVLGLDHAQHDHAARRCAQRGVAANRSRGRIPAVSSMTTRYFGLCPAS